MAVEPASSKPSAHASPKDVLHVERPAAAKPATEPTAAKGRPAKVVVARHTARGVVLVDALVELGAALGVGEELVRRLDLCAGARAKVSRLCAQTRRAGVRRERLASLKTASSPPLSGWCRRLIMRLTGDVTREGRERG